MASTSIAGAAEPSHPVLFSTQTPYPLPSQKFMIPASWKRYQLSQLVNKALSLLKPVPFDFLVRGEILRGTLGEWCAEKGIGEEETLDVEYIESVMPPQRMSTIPHEDWVSSISCQIAEHFLTASYDGSIRLFDYSQTLLHTAATHDAPITSLCIVPTSTSEGSHLLATASQDLTARLTTLTLSADSSAPPHTQTIASLHLHTAPVSCIAANISGTHLLTASWDGLLGLWDTAIPTTDEIPLEEIKSGTDRKKRRKVVPGETYDVPKPKRKAPQAVLKSHTARVSKALFGTSGAAYSCGFDSTLRTWDVEHGVCTHTITAASKPFLDLALTHSGSSALAASTDRTVCQYDLRAAASSAATPSVAVLAHPATPVCITVSPDASATSEHQLLTGAYDGIVRLWDLRSVQGAVASFKVWEGRAGGRKVLDVDWARGVVGVGGEGGVEVWRVGQGERAFPS
ncbi:ribosome biogenesis protein YTM1 [Amylocystis lapponica]|nr:ribosome biogenesis protein YTM1 [Amylocystis lapponica]